MDKLQKGLFGKYAVGGGIGALFYIEGIPVKFIPAYNDLVTEAVTQSVEHHDI